MKGGRARGGKPTESLLLLVLTAPKDAIKWVWRHSGVWGLAALAVVFLAYFCWWNWAKIQPLPFVKPLVARWNEHPLPQADPHRFSIAVAELEHDDPEHPYRRLIVQRLREQFPHVQVLLVDRTLSLEDAPVPDAAERAGRAQAHKYLEQMGADVIIWGTVSPWSDPPQSAPELYWAVSSEVTARKPGEQDLQEGLALPHISWNELVPVFDLLVMTQDAQEQHHEGVDVSGRLRPLIDKVRHLLKESEGHPGWNAEARAATKFILADSLMVLGDLSGKDTPLEAAAAAYRATLKDWPRERVPLKWATTQTHLGNALRLLGERQEEATLLCEAYARHVAAQALISSVAPAYTSMAQENTARSAESLRALSGPQAPQACLNTQ